MNFFVFVFQILTLNMTPAQASPTETCPLEAYRQEMEASFGGEAGTTKSPFKTLLKLTNPLHPRGKVALLLMYDGRQSEPKKPARVRELIRILNEQHPEAEFGDGDILLAMNIFGERQSAISKIALGAINDMTMDIIGVDSYSVANTRDTYGNVKGRPRTVFVIKQKAKDHRDGIKRRLQTQSELLGGVVEVLHETALTLLNQDYFHLHIGHPDFETIYKLLGTNPSTGKALSPAAFSSAYNRAFADLLETSTGLDILYIRPSFWQESPRPDDFAVRAYEWATQKTSDSFIKGFAQEVFRIRTRLTNLVHRPDPRSQFHFHQRPTTSTAEGFANPPGKEYEGADPALAGVTPQQVFGNDFATGTNHQFAPLSSLAETGSPELGIIIKRLAGNGYEELHQLQGINAQKLMNDTNIDLDPLLELAGSLADHGVYLFYPPTVYYKLTSEQRMQLKHPKNKNFVYDPVTNTYSPIRSKNRTNP